MELIHAALLLHSAGRDVTEDSVRDVVDAAGLDVEDAEIKALISALDGVDIDEAVEKNVAVGAAPAAPQQEAEAGEAEAEEDEEAGEDEEEDVEPAADEEEAAEGLGSLF